MGNYRFRFSDMIPNAWFYKLKDMSKTRKNCNSHPLKKKSPTSSSTSQKNHNNSKPRYTYYFTTEPLKPGRIYNNSPVHLEVSGSHRFPDHHPPRKSSKRRDRRRTVYKPSPRVMSSVDSAGFNCHAILNSVPTNSTLTHDQSPDYSLSPFESSPEPESFLSDSEDDEFFAPPQSFDLPAGSYSNSSYNCKLSSSTTDIIIDMNNESLTRKIDKVHGFDRICELELPPILTKPAKSNEKSAELTTKVMRSSSRLDETKTRRTLSVKIVKEESNKKEPRSTSPVVRKSFSNSPGIKLRANSPKIASKKIQAYARKSTSSPSSYIKCRNKSIADSFAVVKSSLDPQRDFRDSMVEMIVENNIRGSKDLEDLLACFLSLNSNQYHGLIIKAFEQIWLDMTNLRL